MLPKRIKNKTQNFSLRRPSTQSYKNELVSPKKIKKINDNQGYVNILNQIVKELNTRPRKYTREQVIRWIQFPNANEKSIRELNLYLRNISNHFNRAIDYFANLLTFDYIIVPVNNTEEQINQPSFLKNYQKVNVFLNKFLVKQEFRKLMQIMMNEDSVYTYYRENDTVATLQILPSDFCKIISRNNVARSYAFDLQVFNKDIYGLTLEDYPEEIQKAYKKYKSTGGDNWFALDSMKAFAFKFNDWTDVNMSPFMGVFLDALQISEDKALQRTKNVISAKQLIHQRIPMRTDKDAKVDQFLVDLDTARDFHETIKSNLEEDGYVTVTSPMELKKVNLDGGATAQANIVRQSETNFYSGIGTSQALFNSEKAGNIGLQKNIQVDENYMFVCYRMFERFMNFMTIQMTGKHNFNLQFLDTTYFNRQDKFKDYLSAGQYGMPTLYMACSSLGLEPKDVDSLIYFENATGIKDKLKPLVSSFTANSNDLMDGNGRPEKDENELSEVAVKQKDEGVNEDRA